MAFKKATVARFEDQGERGQSNRRKMTKTFLSAFFRIVIRITLSVSLAAGLAPAPITAGADEPRHESSPVAGKPSDVILETMQGELARATKELAKAENPPYFICAWVRRPWTTPTETAGNQE